MYIGLYIFFSCEIWQEKKDWKAYVSLIEENNDERVGKNGSGNDYYFYFESKSINLRNL